jgi:hypothetical protein
MIPSLAFSFGAGLVLLAAQASSAADSSPAMPNAPIIVRILGGKDGRPLVHAHLILIAGYDEGDIQHGFWREEGLTDNQGKARLSNELASLPFLQVWVAKKHLCLANPRRARFSVERIRRDGLSTPNRCGTATVEDAPGVFTVFVKAKGAAPLPALPAAAVAADPGYAPASSAQQGPARLRCLTVFCLRLQPSGSLR